MILSKGSKSIKFDNIQKMRKEYCPRIIMIVKILHENANVSQLMSYTEAHQKLGHPGEKITKATATKLSWKLESKTKECEACSIGKVHQKN